MCEVLKVSRSGYYKWRDRPKSARQERREELTQEVRRVYIESRQLYGSPKVTKKLNHGGIKVSQKTVSRIMNEEGMKSRTVKKHKATTNSKHNHPVHENVLNLFIAK
ncbi:IS3 family transposase [Aeribacillus composti]|uniref:IS3 family transposase n=1 Tax=Aeribacillus composti TaxID=1868734 RepID=UPI002E242816|nr:IS3 family transposase [Aeribacillus composti]